ncbi:CatB-related O-acetyltransferase [Nocardioides panacisoli]|uniref:CatB-related O-acetyltransferase n=1 Tax=Nocardioides panacisoli TaxID=627624 RepID=A0ABP7IW08_9ACTN
MLLRLLTPLIRAVLRLPIVARQRWQWARDEVDVAPGSFVARTAVLGKRVRVTVPAYIDPCEIGPYSIIGRVVIRSANHYTEYLNIQEMAQRKVIGGKTMLKPMQRPIRIGAGCWVGDNVTILEGVEIGDGAIVGAGSVVTKSVPAYAVAVGNPARVIRHRYPEEIVELLEPVDWWSWSDEKLRANKDLFELDLANVDPEVLRKRLAELD